MALQSPAFAGFAFSDVNSAILVQVFTIAPYNRLSRWICGPALLRSGVSRFGILLNHGVQKHREQK